MAVTAERYNCTIVYPTKNFTVFGIQVSSTITVILEAKYIFLFEHVTNLHIDNDYSSFANELIGVINDNPNMIPFYTKTMDPSNWANSSFYYTRTACYNILPVSLRFVFV